MIPDKSKIFQNVWKVSRKSEIGRFPDRLKSFLTMEMPKDNLKILQKSRKVSIYSRNH